MKSKTAICAMLVLSLLPGSFALAQGNSDRGDRGDRDDRGDNGRDNRRDNRRDERPDYRSGARGFAGNDQLREWRGAGPNHQFYRGERLPAEYRNRQYVVDDWRGHSLSAPPRGYHWVQTGTDYVLVAIASGIIVQLLLGN